MVVQEAVRAQAELEARRERCKQIRQGRLESQQHGDTLRKQMKAEAKARALLVTGALESKSECALPAGKDRRLRWQVRV